MEFGGNRVDAGLTQTSKDAKPIHPRESIPNTMLTIIEIQKGLKILLQEATAKLDLETARKIQTILDQAHEAERMVNEDIGTYFDEEEHKKVEEAFRNPLPN